VTESENVAAAQQEESAVESVLADNAEPTPEFIDAVATETSADEVTAAE
jgi:hypothetical protein